MIERLINSLASKREKEMGIKYRKKDLWLYLGLIVFGVVGIVYAELTKDISVGMAFAALVAVGMLFIVCFAAWRRIEELTRNN